jgi:hypothetical protein
VVSRVALVYASSVDRVLVHRAGGGITRHWLPPQGRPNRPLGSFDGPLHTGLLPP